jgi:hypothetical protein
MLPLLFCCVSGCVAGTSRNDYCLNSRIIYLTEKDAKDISDMAMYQIVAHNDKYATICLGLPPENYQEN